ILVTDSIIVLFLLGVMLSTSVKVTIAMLVIAPLIGGIVWYVGGRYRRISRSVQDGMADMAQAAEQSLAAQQDVKVHGAQGFEGARYSRIANRILRLNLKIDATKASASALVQMLAAVALAAIVWISTREALAGRLNAGEFVALMTAMMGIIPSLRRITGVQGAISRGVSAAERIFSVLDSHEEADTGAVALDRARGELVFDHVSLHYQGQDAPALRDTSFVARPGTVTAIVGRSGSGKTSLAR